MVFFCEVPRSKKITRNKIYFPNTKDNVIIMLKVVIIYRPFHTQILSLCQIPSVPTVSSKLMSMNCKQIFHKFLFNEKILH